MTMFHRRSSKPIKHTTLDDPKRRHLFKQIAIGSVCAIPAMRLAHAAPTPQKQSIKSSSGYHESEHIKAYYASLMR